MLGLKKKPKKRVFGGGGPAKKTPAPARAKAPPKSRMR